MTAMENLWGWIAGTIGLISGIAGIWYFIADMHSRRSFGWKHVERLLKKMILDIERSRFDPDLVIGIGRGGAILAGILAGNLGQVPLYVIDTVSERRNGKLLARLSNTEGLPNLQDRNVLLVVGELYTGTDLRAGLDLVEELGYKDLRTASLLTHPFSSLQPDFCGIETEKPLTAPWRISDKYKSARI